MSENRFRFAKVGWGGTVYLSPEDGSFSEVHSYSRKVEMKYLLEGAVIVDLLGVDQDILMNWSINGPMVNPHIDRIKRLNMDDVDQLMAEELGRNFGLPLTDSNYHGLDEVPVDVYVKMARRLLPGVRIGEVRNGKIIWTYPPTEPGQLGLFDIRGKEGGMR